MNSCAGSDSNRRYTEVERQLPVQVSRLADRGNTVSVPGLAPHMGCPSHLLFEPAVGGDASGGGVLPFSLRRLAAFGRPPTGFLCSLCSAGSLPGHVVGDHYPPVTSSVATTSGR